MDFKLNREEITTSEVIFDETQEQSVELDYVLPDYYPEIFKIIKCIVTPQILSYNINGNKLTYEMAACIKVLYCSESGNGLQVVDQKLSYTKTADLGRAAVCPKVCMRPKVDYINCRAVNQRRIDVRGAVSIRVKVTDIEKNNVVSDAYGMNIQLKKIPITYPVNKLYTTKRVTVSDEFDLGASKPPIANILRSDAVIVSSDKKVIANKLVAKGEACVNMLYTYLTDGGTDGVESMQFTAPYSQIIDLDGIDEKYDCAVDAEIISCDVKPSTDAEGNAKLADCTLIILISVSAHRVATVEAVTDEYSTLFRSNSSKSDIRLELLPENVSQQYVVKSSIEYPDGEISRIHDVWCDLNGFQVKTDSENGQLIITGNLGFTVMARNIEGAAVALDSDESFEAAIPVSGLSEFALSDLKVVPISCSYNLASDNTVEAKAELKIYGTVSNTALVKMVTDIEMDENEPVKRDGDYALKLYFTDENEDLWEIAKKYGTSVAAIMEENDIDGDAVADREMILIPIL